MSLPQERITGGRGIFPKPSNVTLAPLDQFKYVGIQPGASPGFVFQVDDSLSQDRMGSFAWLHANLKGLHTTETSPLSHGDLDI